MTDDVKGALGRAMRGLTGGAPAPFVKGARLELVTIEADRFVRGVVLVAGSGMAQLDVSNPGDPRRPMVNLIAYADVARIREATAGLPNGNWNQGHRDRRLAEASGRHGWWKWQAPR